MGTLDFFRKRTEKIYEPKEKHFWSFGHDKVD